MIDWDKPVQVKDCAAWYDADSCVPYRSEDGERLMAIFYFDRSIRRMRIAYRSTPLDVRNKSERVTRFLPIDRDIGWSSKDAADKFAGGPNSGIELTFEDGKLVDVEIVEP